MPTLLRDPFTLREPLHKAYERTTTTSTRTTETTTSIEHVKTRRSLKCIRERESRNFLIGLGHAIIEFVESQAAEVELISTKQDKFVVADDRRIPSPQTQAQTRRV